MEYKKTYPKQDIKDLIEWFRKNMDSLPKSFVVDKGTTTDNLQEAILDHIEMATTNIENPTYGASIRRFFNLKEKLIAEGYAEP